ncbi:hypothetical protein F8280_04670 [Micromonospora noduli]|uniref:Uncharacterized protein n=1 Tax=Micromonospora noduli TaxID=709876 RepID=A0ABX9D0G1_9ACTN|nr:hypothetical protein [Micromonospora noduli]KAB1928043.1 hypothetical protein F8280_04670 [Micromonospora noduli]RAO14744.1 hypothetical protein MED15_04395 [Micromonospora noduli]RAO55281.1 hypothetical protein ONO86_01030 [Micromonospora noduli]
MTAEGFREVDIDLLADYLGGALDGTPQQDEVAQLVSADPSWAEAYALLAPAVTEVRTDLTRWAEPSPEMPSAITDRLLAALASAEPADTSTEEAPADAGTPFVVPAQGGAGRRPAMPTPGGAGRQASTGPGRRQRGWARRGAPVAAAAIAVIAVALGLNQLSMRASDDSAGTNAMNQPASAPEGVAGAGTARTTGPALRSGTNYTPQTLGDAYGTDAPGTPATSRATGNTPSEQPKVDAEGGRRPSPDGSDQLARLTDEAALTSCLASIATEHGSAPLVVEVIDYARFQGDQALVIHFTDATGARWAWVSGPECGVPGSGSDSRYSARVG